jgi:hypothetical protein
LSQIDEKDKRPSAFAGFGKSQNAGNDRSLLIIFSDGIGFSGKEPFTSVSNFGVWALGWLL